jgi:23S rRNA (adenine2503-C2)-methyltransferase
MGEPLYNFENVRDALSVVSDGEGLSLSKRRITLSTAGVVPMIPRAGEEIGSMLAISLHAARDDVRDVIVPLNKKYPIKDLLKACRESWPGAPYECSDWERIEEFGDIVNRAGYASPIRTPRGRDIMAACGQLKSESVKQRASDRVAELRSQELSRMPH